MTSPSFATTVSPASDPDGAVVRNADEGTHQAQGPSILKEIFPEHGMESDPVKTKTPASGRLPLQLLASLPSPSRATPPAQNQGQTSQKYLPCCPPTHAPALMVVPPVPPPPQYMPSGTSHQQSIVPACFDGALSYRERLRAGGRGALQRAIDAGLKPKERSVPVEQMPAHVAGQTGNSNISGAAMQCMMVGDGQQMWGGEYVQDADCWQVGANQPQVLPNYNYSQHGAQLMPQMVQQIVPGEMAQTSQAQMASQMSSIQQVQLPNMHLQQQLAVLPATAPHMQMPEQLMHTEGIDKAATELDRCMAIVMPQAQFACDKDLMAAQLKAAADCQYYED